MKAFIAITVWYSEGASKTHFEVAAFSTERDAKLGKVGQTLDLKRRGLQPWSGGVFEREVRVNPPAKAGMIKRVMDMGRAARRSIERREQAQ